MTFGPDSRFVSHIVPAANVEPRRGKGDVSLLILHYTGMASAEKAVAWLARPESKVSCHYVVDVDGTITQMVPEKLRAWHAGVSYWRGETDINSRSIGVEIQNPGHEHGYPDFSARQMRGVIDLSRDVAKRHALLPDGILAHSDVAPGRKIDPGEKFSWARLARDGVGLWVTPSRPNNDEAGFGEGEEDERILDAQRMLRAFGYDAPLTGSIDRVTANIIRAFQLHFRQRRVDGRLDRATQLTLQRVVAAANRDVLTA